MNQRLMAIQPGIRHCAPPIARHIWLSRGMHVDPEAVTVTNGTQQALDLITKVLIERVIASRSKIPGIRGMAALQSSWRSR